MNSNSNHKRSADVDAPRKLSSSVDDQYWQELGTEHRRTGMSDDLRMRLNKVASAKPVTRSDESPDPLAIPVLWLSGTAAMVLIAGCAIWIYLAQSGASSVNERADGTQIPHRGNDDLDHGDSDRSDVSPEDRQRRDQVADQETRQSQIREEIRQLELEIELAQQITHRLTTPPALDPIKTARFRLDADGYQSTQVQVLGATMISLADFNRELGHAGESIHESYSRIIRMFPETEWADVAQQRLDESF